MLWKKFGNITCGLDVKEIKRLPGFMQLIQYLKSD